MEKLTKLKRDLLDPNQDDYNISIALRLYDYQVAIIDKIILHAKTIDGDKKYSNRSHFIRSAIMQTILIELHKMDIKPGRPKNGK
jgi:hypothetical protein